MIKKIGILNKKLGLIMQFQNQELIIETYPVGELGVNCSILYSPQTLDAIIIDPGENSDEIMSIIKSKKIKVQTLLHTHGHFDHIACSEEISKMIGAKMLLHQKEKQLYQALPEQGSFMGKILPTPAPLNYFLSDGDLIGIENNNPDLKNLLTTILTPGHTPGHCCFYTTFFPTPLLFSGDLLFYESVGRADLPGGNSTDLYKSIKERIYTLPDDTVVIPGHGQFTTIAHEKKHNPYIQAQG